MSTPADATKPVTEEAPVLPPPELPEDDKYKGHDHEVGTECAGGCIQTTPV